MPIRVLLADDHLIVRQGLRALLEREGFEVTGETSDGIEASRLAAELQPDLAVLDFAMPRLNGIEAAQRIREVSPATKSILLTMYTEDQYVLAALRAGFRGYVVKSEAAADLVQAIHEVSQGRVYLSPKMSRAAVQAYLERNELPADPLTSRERQILQLIAEGNSTKHIGETLGISVKTVESHRKRIKEKLDIHATASLVRYAIRRGIIEP